MKRWTLAELAKETGAQLRGNADLMITGLATLRSAGPEQLSFLANPLYRSALAVTGAGAVILREEDAADFDGNALIAANPYAVYAALTHHFDRTPRREPGIHASAVVDPDAVIDPSAVIGARAVIESGAVIGPACVIEPGAFIGARVSLGQGCHVRANAVIHHDCVLGNRVVIHSGAVIGDDGFGFAPANGRWNKIAQIGRVVIHDDADIGANTTIDRGALDDTVIHQGVIIDNLVMIAHNVEVGAHTAIAGCCGISGSTKIGSWCVLAGGVGLVGHIEVCDKVHITGMTMVTKSITKPGSYSSGTAFDTTDNWKKMAVRLKKLDETTRRLRELEGLVQQLTSKTD
ncbi:UDP-3-O-[3-hydroxymyristoyl] glucosamine N-acyltransferase [Fluviicoccus keumensis]|uniref:UDP-3-O-acylglucosamine N-acyltransferase n=1 Tax=Fluviicoccus keumensis TaxID=1435465 RepID=A0A4Q7Z3A2_9GAMM|nr:UDP-3-O-(3-hydroxymyristoyl)glucosamine N-acyltransferase [Fluviicoccus keumensis]RZU44842.1 UDP-3-O-[3-hydroxymyristoyl] glucosamine N-acyltransferase [Fluviicoccus keumensis]